MGFANDNGSALSLYTERGERKYLAPAERRRFYNARFVLDRPEHITFVETIYWTGCRVSEALGLGALHIDYGEQAVVIRSLKKRGANKGRHYRSVPVPEEYLERLDIVHNVRRIQAANDGSADAPLWRFSRSTAWRLIKTVMEAANIIGVRASPKGLRHTFGVHAVLCAVPESRIRKWLGHEDQATTAIYLNVSSAEDRRLAERMWA